MNAEMIDATDTASMAGGAVLEVCDLTIATTGRRRRTIVDHLSLSLAAGESLAIVGESGSGKSLTAKALVNLLPSGVIATGSVQLGKDDVLAQSRHGMRALWGNRISMVLQDPFTSLNPIMKVWVQVAEAAQVAADHRISRRQRRTVAAELLAEVGITDDAVLDRYPFELSGGMRQRVAIAAAVAASPKVLIADEPTTALDTTTQQDVIALLQRLRRDRQMGLIMITHDLRLAFSTCDRVLILYAGQVLEVAPSAAIWRSPLHPYSLGLMLSEPPVDRTVPELVAIAGAVPDAGQTPDGCVFAPRCGWVQDACRTKQPALVAAGDQRLSACRRITEIGPEMRALRAATERSIPDRAAASPEREAGLLRVHQLTKQYPNSARPAVRDADLVVQDGESVALVGESGSGKTTIARCLLGLETPSAGTIKIAGADVSDYRRLDPATARAVRSTVQIVFQDPYSSLNPMRSVGFTLRQAISVRAPDAAPTTVATLLDMVGLPGNYAGRRPGSLSGGERQRVAIARALAVAPKLLVCDEIVSALDVSVQAQILNLLAQLRRDLGLSLLFVSHDLAVVRQVTDRTYVLYRGEVVESGATSTVLDDPRHPYTKRLVAAVPSVGADPEAKQ